MVQIPLPGVPDQPGQSGFFVAPETTPQQDATGQQLADVGDSAQRLGFEASRIADLWQDQYDDAKNYEADNRNADAHRKALLDNELEPDGITPKGYLLRQGKDAGPEAREKAFKQLREQQELIEQSLDTDVQREQFRRAAADRMLHSETLADKHQWDQVHTYKAGAISAGIDEALVDRNYDLLKKRTTDLAAFAKLDPVESRLLMLEKTTAYHAQEILLLAPQEPDKAKTYLQQNKAEIDPKTQVDLNHRIEVEKDKLRTQEIRAQGEKVFLGIMDEVSGKGSLTEQEKMARDIVTWTRKGGTNSAMVMDNVQDRIAAEFNQRHQLVRQEQQETLDAAEAFWTSNPTAGLDGLKTSNPDLFEKIGMMGVTPQAINAQRRILAEHLARDPAMVKLGQHINDIQTMGYFIQALEDRVLDEKDPYKKLTLRAALSDWQKLQGELIAQPEFFNHFAGIAGRKKKRTAEEQKKHDDENMAALQRLLGGAPATSTPGGK